MDPPLIFSGELPLATLFSVACELAGQLAEAGCTSVRLTQLSTPDQSLTTRQTDLPGIIHRRIGAAQSPSPVPLTLRCQVESGEVIVSLWREAGRVCWSTNSSLAAASLECRESE